MIKTKLQKIIKIYFLEDLQLSLLNFNFFLTYKIHKMLVLLKNHLSFLIDSTLECFLRNIMEFF